MINYFDEGNGHLEVFADAAIYNDEHALRLELTRWGADENQKPNDVEVLRPAVLEISLPIALRAYNMTNFQIIVANDTASAG